MNSDETFGLVFVGFLFLIVLIGFLAIPIKGNIFGMEVNIPIIGWIGLAALAIFALIVGVKGAMHK